MYENTEFTLSRDCEAIQIPSGQKTTIPAGTQGVITQSLGEVTRSQRTKALAAWRRKTSTLSDWKSRSRGRRKNRQPRTAKFQKTMSGTSSGNVMIPRFPLILLYLGLVYDCRLIKKEEGGTRVEVKMTLTAPAAEWDRQSRTMRRARFWA
jgi:Predicted metal-sulfur cluster biosynthetic enzyme